MAQADYTIDNASGATVRADINATLAAIVTQNSGASAPATTFAHMLWADTTNGVLKRRNAANSGWVVLAPLASTMVQAKSANYTVLLSDYGTLLDCTNTIALSLTAAATLGDGFWFSVRNSGSGIVTIDPSGAETIDGAATIALGQGDSAIVWCNGTTFKTVGRGSAQLYAANTFTADQTIQGAVVVGSPTGGNKGAGTINAVALYRNGAAVLPIAVVRLTNLSSTPTVTAHNGGLGTLSATRNGMGDYTVSWGTELTNPMVECTVQTPSTTNSLLWSIRGSGLTGTSVRVLVMNIASSAVDPEALTLTIYGSI